MADMNEAAGQPPGKNAERTGVLLTNLGTPDAPTTASVRTYLREFLSDPRVVRLPRALWWPILYGYILPLRAKRSAKAYAKIWTEQGSPLRSISQAIANQLQQRFDGAGLAGYPIKVVLGMRYGKPSIRQALETLHAGRTTRLLVLPLYPQYSTTTTASTLDEVTAVMKTWQWSPTFKMVNDYYQAPAYIDALAASVRNALVSRNAEDSRKLMMSFHGIPESYSNAGDPYQQQCRETARLLAERLTLAPEQWQLTFQSRLGARRWLQPYTDATLKQWAAEGTKSVDVVCPGFPADCLETLEEIDMQNRSTFLHHGGERFHYVPALNTREDHLTMLSDLIIENIQDWD
jgi:ferrochelatase